MKIRVSPNLPIRENPHSSPTDSTLIFYSKASQASGKSTLALSAPCYLYSHLGVPPSDTIPHMKSYLPFSLLLTLAALVLVTSAAPPERTLGENARLVYLHGAWVWTAMVMFMVAGVLGLAGLLAQRKELHEWSLAFGRTALLLWITFLPQSLYLMQANWNGIFLDEPRFRIPFNLGITGLMLQVGVSFFPRWTASLVNLLFAGMLFWIMNGIQTVLHPEGPIQASSSTSIQLFFYAMLVLMIALAIQIAYTWRGRWRKKKPVPASP